MQFGSMSVINLLYSLCKETLQYTVYEKRQLVQINELCKETSQREKDLPYWLIKPHLRLHVCQHSLKMTFERKSFYRKSTYDYISYINQLATGETKSPDLLFTLPLFLSLYFVLRGAEQRCRSAVKI